MAQAFAQGTGRRVQGGTPPARALADVTRIVSACYERALGDAVGHDRRDQRLVVSVEVESPELCLRLEPRIAETLYLLTGRPFVVSLVRGSSRLSVAPTGAAGQSARADTVVLTSGGLDSLAGASSLLAPDQDIAVLGVPDGNPAMERARAHVIGLLVGRGALDLGAQTRGSRMSPRIQGGPSAGIAGSGLARQVAPLLYATAGATACLGIGAERLVIPASHHVGLSDEGDARNGAPAADRVGLVIELLNELLGMVGAPVYVANPFSTTTKAELVAQWLCPSFDAGDILATVSCHHAGAPDWPCGRCAKCILRAIALECCHLPAETHAADPLTVGWTVGGDTPGPSPLRELARLVEAHRAGRLEDPFRAPAGPSGRGRGLHDYRRAHALRRFTNEAVRAFLSAPTQPSSMVAQAHRE